MPLPAGDSDEGDIHAPAPQPYTMGFAKYMQSRQDYYPSDVYEYDSDGNPIYEMTYDSDGNERELVCKRLDGGSDDSDEFTYASQIEGFASKVNKGHTRSGSRTSRSRTQRGYGPRAQKSSKSSGNASGLPMRRTKRKLTSTSM